MKVYHLYNGDGEWMTVTQNKKAIMRKIMGKRGQSEAGNMAEAMAGITGGNEWCFVEETVADDWVPKKKNKPATGCKTFKSDHNGLPQEVSA